VFHIRHSQTERVCFFAVGRSRFCIVVSSRVLNPLERTAAKLGFWASQLKELVSRASINTWAWTYVRPVRFNSKSKPGCISELNCRGGGAEREGLMRPPILQATGPWRGPGDWLLNSVIYSAPGPFRPILEPDENKPGALTVTAEN